MTTRFGALSNFFLKVTDLALVLSALGLTIVLRYSPSNNVDFAVDYLSERIKVSNALLGVGLLITWHLALAVQGLYLSHRFGAHQRELLEVARGVLIGALALLVAAQIGRWPTINLVTVSLFGLIAFSMIAGMRLLLRWNLRRLRRRGHNVKALLMVGGGLRGQRFAEYVELQQDLGYKIIGYVDPNRDFADQRVGNAIWLGTLEDLPLILANEVIDEATIALPIKSHYTQIETAIALLEEQGITTHLLSDLFPQKLARSLTTDLNGLPIISLHSVPPFSWRTEAKRLFDLVAGTFLLLMLTPVLLAAAMAIKLTSPGPIFFVQDRFGLNKRRFRMIKFRTMRADAEARMQEIEHLNEKSGPIFKIRNDPRITPVGRWLRKTSIDELPQLINVLFGEMSIVGPRPLSVRDALRMEVAWQKRRFSVKPGLTCLWQISGRSNLSFEQWMELDLKYIDHWSLKLDFSILVRTIPAIVTARGAS
jgi:exopolysaccharide biosynthesis polyprenyl glycosylphosphotransferase